MNAESLRDGGLLGDARRDTEDEAVPGLQGAQVAPTDGSPARRTKLLTDIYNTCTFTMHVTDPSDFKEAVKSKAWREAMDDEINSIISNDTWELCDLPDGKKAIGLKWIFKTKFNSEGKIQKLKARVVAKGYSQRPGIDYEEVFSPVARMETVRMVLALAAHSGWEVFHFDVKSAFLNGDI